MCTTQRSRLILQATIIIIGRLWERDNRSISLDRVVRANARTSLLRLIELAEYTRTGERISHGFVIATPCAGRILTFSRLREIAASMRVMADSSPRNNRVIGIEYLTRRGQSLELRREWMSERYRRNWNAIERLRQRSCERSVSHFRASKFSSIITHSVKIYLSINTINSVGET